MTTNDYPQKITFGEMRSYGVRDVLVYCRDHHCSHHIRMGADFWPDRLRTSKRKLKLILHPPERRMLPVLDLDPAIGPAPAVQTLAVLGDHAFQPHPIELTR